MIDDGGAFREIQDKGAGSGSPGSDDLIMRFTPASSAFPLQFNPQIFKTIIHYCCWICEDPRVLDFTKLNRICWYSERHNYLLRRTPLTGATYRKFSSGPIATPTDAAITELEKAGALARRSIGFTDTDRYFAISKPNLSLLDSDQIAMIETIVRSVCFNITSAVIDTGIHDHILQITRLGEEIPYFTVFAGRAGLLTEDDITWAIGRLRDQQIPAVWSNSDMLEATEPSARVACAALIWHLLREPEIGSALHLPKASWFLYKQRGLASRVPEVAAVYTLVMDELVVRGLRFEPELGG
jgi:hypothetical protein